MAEGETPHADPTPELRAARAHRAVVDIGSNSVRLVVYAGPLRAPFQICNEKALCGLGRDITPDGDMNADAVSAALSTLKRFRALLREHGDPPTDVVATAAVRDARNGDDFVAEAREIGFKVTTIDGKREGLLAALGVRACIPDAAGLAGDMGGGSLELARMTPGAADAAIDTVSLPIGPFRLMRLRDQSSALEVVGDALHNVPWIDAAHGEKFYAVGGAWRAVAKIHMARQLRGLPILHHYEIDADEVDELCTEIMNADRATLEMLKGAPRKRLDTLPLASLALRETLRRSGASRLVICAGGVREGLAYESLSPSERTRDPLAVGADFIAVRYGPRRFGAAEPFIEPIVESAPSGLRRLAAAAATMMDVAAFFHPDLRGGQAYSMAVSAPLYGVTHAERVILGSMLYVRHEGKVSSHPDAELFVDLSPDEQRFALHVGLALRFAGSLAPRAPGLLARCRLRLQNDALEFFTDPDELCLLGETPQRRLFALAAALGVDVRVNGVELSV